MPKTSNFCGIICEFNPLHFGHREILEKASQIAPVVCVMSGNFVQRGEPAIIDKYSRTKLALENGADLVIELPLPWACSGAEHFSEGAVFLLKSLGLSGSLLFGSECGDVSILEETADILLSQKFNDLLTNEVKNQKNSFASIREFVLTKYFGEKYGKVIKSSNNILGIEYIKAIKKQSADIAPLTITRVGAGHDQNAKKNEFMSASEIRNLILSGAELSNILHPSTVKTIENLVLSEFAPCTSRNLERAILAKLRSMSISDFSLLPDLSEGLENKLFSAVKKAWSLDELYSLVKSKRYSHARIRRMIMHAFLGVTHYLPNDPPYIRILGMTDTGEKLVKSAKVSIPFAVRFSDFEKLGGDCLKIFEFEAHADDLYSLSSPKIQPCGMDYYQHIIKHKKFPAN